jgi:PAS domain S-box-containing protein
LIIPVFVDQELAGFVGFDNVESTGRWRDEDLFLLRIAAEIVGTAIQRTRAAETLMRLSHQRELILNSAGEGIYGLDPQGRTTFLNPTAAHLLGWEAAELFGRSMHEAVHHSKADGSPYHPEECPIYAALKDGSVHTVANEVFWKKDGTPFPVDYVSTPIHEHGRVVGAVVVFKDITERKVAEDALRESEQLFRQVTESIKEVFWMSDPHKNAVLYVSPGYETVWGRSCESLHASPRSWLDAIHPDDRDRVLQAALTKQVTGEYDEEYRIIRPDGTVRWIHDRAFPVKDTSGSVYRIAGLAEDVTEQRERGRGNRSAPPPENR